MIILKELEVKAISGGLLGTYACVCISADGYCLNVKRLVGSTRPNETAAPSMYTAYTGFDNVNQCIDACKSMGYSFCFSLNFLEDIEVSEYCNTACGGDWCCKSSMYE